MFFFLSLDWQDFQPTPVYQSLTSCAFSYTISMWEATWSEAHLKSRIFHEGKLNSWMIDLIVSHAFFLMYKTGDFFSPLKSYQKGWQHHYGLTYTDCFAVCLWVSKRTNWKNNISFFNEFQKCIIQKKIAVWFHSSSILKFDFRSWDGCLKASDSKMFPFSTQGARFYV